MVCKACRRHARPRTCVLIAGRAAGDFTTAHEKIREVIEAGSIFGTSATTITPNEHGDWLNQRQDEFLAFTPMGTKEAGAGAIFGTYCKGLNTARSVWAYASSETQLRDQLGLLISTYESDRKRLAANPAAALTLAESRIKWSRSLEQAARRNVSVTFEPDNIRESTFRPFHAQKVYFDRHLNDQTYSLFRFFPRRGIGRGTIKYNTKLILSGIPDHAYRYVLGSRSAIEWIMERYRVKADKASGVINDPNGWSREVNNPRYILDLLARIVTVSIETMKLVDALPPLDIRGV